MKNMSVYEVLEESSIAREAIILLERPTLL
jgi:hypothetical protein